MGKLNFLLIVFCLSQCSTFSQRIPSVFQELPGMENYWGKERKRVSRFSIETFWSHRTETIRRGIFLRFTIFLVSEKIIDKRGSRYHDFPWKLFSLRVSNIFVEEPFWLPRTFWYGKLLREREKAGVTIFHRNFLVSQNRNNSRRNFSAFHYISGIGKNYW